MNKIFGANDTETLPVSGLSIEERKIEILKTLMNKNIFDDTVSNTSEVNKNINTVTSNIFKAYKEQTLNVKSNGTTIRTKSSSKNIQDLSVFCTNTQRKIIEWLFRLSDDSFIFDINSYKDDYFLHIEQLEVSKPSVLISDIIKTNAHGDYDIATTEKYISEHDIEYSDNEIKELKEEADKIQKQRDEIESKIIEYQNNCIKEFNRIYKVVSNIDKTSIDIHKQSGILSLYIGCFFISGVVQHNKINAPILLFPIEIVKITNGIIEIKQSSSREVVINKPLLLLLESISGVKIVNELTGELLDSIIKNGLYSIKIEMFNNSPMIAYSEYDKYKLDKIEDIDAGINKLTLYNAACIGIYNISTSIYDDFTKLENKTSNKIIDRLLIGDNETITSERQIIQNPVYSTPDLKIISSLDSSQECAVYAASRTKGIVIYGPPGTGKSQVITNIIADYIAKGKSVLMVSEKKTALDVVYKRLKQLNMFAMILSDSNDIESFKSKLEETEQEILYESAQLSNKVQSICTSIDNGILELDKLEQELNTIVGCTEKTLSFLYQHSEDTEVANALALNLKVSNSQILKITFEKLTDTLSYMNKDIYRKASNILNNSSISRIIDINELSLHELVSNIKEYGNKHTDYILTCETIEKELKNIDLYIDNETILHEIDTLICDMNIGDENIINDIEYSIIDLDRLLKIIKEYKKNFSILSYVNTIDELDKNIDRIIAYKYEELYAEKSKLYNIVDTFRDMMYKSSKFVNIDVQFDVSTYEYILISAKAVINALENTANVNNKNELEQFIYNMYSIDGNNINQIIATYTGTQFSQILVNLSEEEYTEYLRNISGLAYKPNKLFKRFDADNSKNYSILLSLNKMLNDKMNNTYKKEIEKIQHANEEKAKLCELVGIQKISSIDDIYGIANTVLKEIDTHITSIIDTIDKRRDETYSEIKQSILNNQSTNNYYIKQIEEVTSCNIQQLKCLIKQYLIDISTKKKLSQGKLDVANEHKTELDILKKSITKLIGSIDEQSISDLIILYSEYEKYFDEVHELYGRTDYEKEVLRLICSDYTQSDIINAYCKYHISTYGGNVSNLIKNYNSIINNTESLENDKISETIKDIVAVNSKIVKDGFSTQSLSLYQIQRDLKKKRKGKSIRQVIQEYGNTIIPMYRVWMLTPEVVSDILPLEKDMFDVVIFDEASQMFLYNALPSLYRAKRAVVAGDDKQLKPTSFFSKEISSDEATEILDDTTGKDTSLLDQAKINFSSITLTFHYRAKYAELIQYSNYAFYSGRLKLAPNVIRKSINNKPIEFIKVDGIRQDSANEIEARETVELLNKLLKTTKDTIGIITLSSKQKECIQDILDEKCQNDNNFSTLLSIAQNRTDDGEDVGLFIKPIEEVQGDERDIIIMSLGLGKNENNRVPLSQLGPIIKDGGANRLNVMISRSKKKQYIISSITSNDLDISGSKSDGARIFKGFLEYALAVSNLRYDSIEHILGASKLSEATFDSPFEEQVFVKLQELGYDVETQVGVRGYKIDLAVYDNDLGRYIAGIECDGATYHSSKSARERDITRQKFLESRGWKILRIWSRDWWKNSSSEIHRIDNELQKIRDYLINKPILDAQEEKKMAEEAARAAEEEERRREEELAEQERKKQQLKEIKKMQEETVKITDDSMCLDIDLLSAKESDVKGYRLEAVVFDNEIISASKWYEILEIAVKRIAKADNISYGYIQKNIPKQKIIFINSNECGKAKALDENGEFFIDTKQPAYGFISKAQKVLLQSNGNHIIKIRINQSTKYERKSSK